MGSKARIQGAPGNGRGSGASPGQRSAGRVLGAGSTPRLGERRKPSAPYDHGTDRVVFFLANIMLPLIYIPSVRLLFDISIRNRYTNGSCIL